MCYGISCSFNIVPGWFVIRRLSGVHFLCTSNALQNAKTCTTRFDTRRMNSTTLPFIRRISAETHTLHYLLTITETIVRRDRTQLPRNVAGPKQFTQQKSARSKSSVPWRQHRNEHVRPSHHHDQMANRNPKPKPSPAKSQIRPQIQTPTPT
jgi:hypothetical protein